MSAVELICEKAKSLPGGLQSEALGFVEYLSRRMAAVVPRHPGIASGG
jgi:hypothetical protein